MKREKDWGRMSEFAILDGRRISRLYIHFWGDRLQFFHSRFANHPLSSSSQKTSVPYPTRNWVRELEGLGGLEVWGDRSRNLNLSEFEAVLLSSLAISLQLNTRDLAFYIVRSNESGISKITILSRLEFTVVAVPYITLGCGERHPVYGTLRYDWFELRYCGSGTV